MSKKYLQYVYSMQKINIKKQQFMRRMKDDVERLIKTPYICIIQKINYRYQVKYGIISKQ